MKTSPNAEEYQLKFCESGEYLKYLEFPPDWMGSSPFGARQHEENMTMQQDLFINITFPI